MVENHSKKTVSTCSSSMVGTTYSYHPCQCLQKQVKILSLTIDALRKHLIDYCSILVPFSFRLEKETERERATKKTFGRPKREKRFFFLLLLIAFLLNFKPNKRKYKIKQDKNLITSFLFPSPLLNIGHMN